MIYHPLRLVDRGVPFPLNLPASRVLRFVQAPKSPSRQDSRDEPVSFCPESQSGHSSTAARACFGQDGSNNRAPRFQRIMRIGTMLMSPDWEPSDQTLASPVVLVMPPPVARPLFLSSLRPMYPVLLGSQLWISLTSIFGRQDCECVAA